MRAGTDTNVVDVAAAAGPCLVTSRLLSSLKRVSKAGGGVDARGEEEEDACSGLMVFARTQVKSPQ